MLAALLFTAACAWLAAALFTPRGAAGPEAAAETSAPTWSLRGIVLRRELALEAGEIPDGAEDGKRLSAAETGREPGVYLADADGLEALTPDDALPLSPARLDALLAAAPERAGAGRLLTARDCCCAALCDSGAPLPEPGTACRLLFEGVGGEYAAAVLAVSEEDGRRAVLLRIPDGAQPLARLRFVRAELIG